MSYPNATLLSFDGGRIHPVVYTDTDHYKVTRAFLMDHETATAALLADED